MKRRTNQGSSGNFHWNNKKKRTTGYCHSGNWFGGVEHSAENQPRNSGRYGRERTSTNNHRAGLIRGKKIERCTGNRNGPYNHWRNGRRTRPIEPPKRQANKPKEDKKLQKQQSEYTPDNLSKLFDKSLLAELTTEDTWMDRLRRVNERWDKQGFELMGPYTNPLWSQMAVQDECILVNNRLAVRLQLRQANPPGSSWSENHAGSLTITMLAAYAEGHSESSGRVP